jgi:hypothetical protein
MHRDGRRWRISFVIFFLNRKYIGRGSGSGLVRNFASIVFIVASFVIHFR